jgi:hypothetical protein
MTQLRMRAILTAENPLTHANDALQDEICPFFSK